VKISELKVLSPEELAFIDGASRDILSEVGVVIRSERVLSLLEDHGVAVDHDRLVATFKHGQVQKAVDRVPRDIRVHDRNRSSVVSLGEGHPPRFASGHNAVFTWHGAGAPRTPATKQEVGEFAKLANYLDQVDVVGPEAMPQDVPARSSLLHGFDAVINNTVKPVLFSPENDRELAAIIDMLRVASGGGRAGENPMAICQFSPSSPFVWSEGAIEGFVRVVKEGLPCTILPGPLAGATSPYSLVGNLIQKNCEVLSGVVIAQLLNPGAPLLSYNGGGQFDMRSMTAVFGTAEVTLILIAGSQLAHFYHLPTHACIPNSDSHELDEQLGMENALNVIAGTLGGSDLMVNAGMFAAGETAAFEQLVLDNDLFALARRMARGISVDPQHACLDSFRRTGPMGNYLEDPSTLRFLRSDEWATSEIFTREKYENWRSKGAKSVVEKARERADFLKRGDDVSLDASQRREIAAIIRAFEQDPG
jgi:trimethylamine---corrinoid protein Co-methyltransferase